MDFKENGKDKRILAKDEYIRGGFRTMTGKTGCPDEFSKMHTPMRSGTRVMPTHRAWARVGCLGRGKSHMVGVLILLQGR